MGTLQSIFIGGGEVPYVDPTSACGVTRAFVGVLQFSSKERVSFLKIGSVIIYLKHK